MSRIRNKYMPDYGITNEESHELYRKCRNLTEGETATLRQIALEICDPIIADLIVKSLTEGLSYYKLEKEIRIPLCANDFYGYRRKVLVKFMEELK